MRRRRHLAVAFLSGLPLLILGLVWTAGKGSAATVGTIVLWAAAVLLLETVVWRSVAEPMREMMRDFGAATGDEARWRLRELRTAAELCRVDRSRMADLLEDLSSGLGEGLLAVDPDLKIRLINPVAMRFCGAERVGPEAHLLEILREPEVVEAFQEAAGGANPSPRVVENPRGLWEVRAFPVRGGGAVGLLADVGLVRRAAEFRRRFVQDLSHELRSPLTVLRTTVEALEDEVEPRLAAMLVRQVERLDRLTAELYELASIEAGHVELDLAPVVVSEVARDVARDFRPEAERAEVELHFDMDDCLQCLCDRRGLYRVLSNLVDNAVKFNCSGGWVRVVASRMEDKVAIEVADSGEGIPSGELQAVLQRFYRVDRARTPGDGGLGLGLAIVKHLVQNMGGALELDSREAVGTTVTLRFPQAG
ncbi:MAG: sensor histidine kinase [Thermoanaerobaculales bacterium]